MKYTDDFEQGHGNGLPTAYMGVVVFLFVLTVFGIVVVTNRPKGGSGGQIPPSAGAAAAESETQTGEQAAVTEGLLSGGRTAEELDFWDMYPEATETAQESETETETETEPDPSNDGKHTLIKNDSREEEWVSINPYLRAHAYDFTGLVYQEPVMEYYEESRKASYLGADLSERNGEVDFGRLKKAGVEFVMLKLGGRGYGSGQLMMDARFEENIQKALEAELDVGVYFYSQAVNETEVLEEANFVYQALQDYEITYPVAYYMELPANDTSRIEGLTREQKTKMATTFMDALRNAGYKTILYGTKEWFLLKVDLNKLQSYDIWLSQQKDVPDYPYQFVMWRYKTDAKLNGVEGSVDLNLCFVDYSQK